MAYNQTFVNDTSKNKVEIQEHLDMTKVDAIVSRIKSKYEKQGLLEDPDSKNLRELRGLIAEGKRAKIEILKPSDLSYSFNPLVRKVGEIYTKFSKFFDFISKKILSAMPESKLLAYELYSADMNYSVSQYLAISSVILFFVNTILIIAFFAIFLLLGITFLVPLALTIMLFIASIFVVLKYPTSVAKKEQRK